MEDINKEALKETCKGCSDNNKCDKQDDIEEDLTDKKCINTLCFEVKRLTAQAIFDELKPHIKSLSDYDFKELKKKYGAK